MDILEILYDNPPKERRFLPRKCEILAKKTALFGPRRSGKSSIIIDYLSKFSAKEALYIDFSDSRVEEIGSLQSFIDKNHIKLVVLEHFDYQCQIPQADEVILSSVKPLNIEGFESVFVPLLDFEEFAAFAFDKKHQSIESIFNLYEKVGTYPQIALGGEEARHRHIQMMIKTLLLNPSSFEILKTAANFEAKPISVYKIYELLKPKKLSKDTVYSAIEALREEFLVYLLPKFPLSKAAKKLYLSDFAIRNAFTFEKDFAVKFESLVFCELSKKGAEVFYTDEIDFYIPAQESALLCVPFLPSEFIKRKFAKLSKELKTLGVKTLQVITVGNEGDFESEGIACEIVPFWEWAMR